MEYGKIQQAQRDIRRDGVLLTAAQLFMEKGIEAVKMTDVAAECDLGVASLYRYFGTKTKLLIGVGCLLWQDIRALYSPELESSAFKQLCGCRQLLELYNVFPNLLSYHPGFLKFVHEFDAAMLRERVPASQLREYEQSLGWFFDAFEAAVAKGLSDGSVRPDLDIELIYLSSTHALMAVCQKFVAGGILEGDDERRYLRELGALIDMTMHYIKTDEKGRE